MHLMPFPEVAEWILKTVYFGGSDLDRNERLDRGEVKSIFNLGNKQVYNKHDTNRDGYITKPEFYN